MRTHILVAVAFLLSVGYAFADPAIIVTPAFITQALADARYLLLSGGTSNASTGGQFAVTKDPASTAVTDTSLLANPATCAANEPLMGAAVAGVNRAKVDCEGDMTVAGAIGTVGVASTAQVSSIFAPSVISGNTDYVGARSAPLRASVTGTSYVTPMLMLEDTSTAGDALYVVTGGGAYAPTILWRGNDGIAVGITATAGKLSADAFSTVTSITSPRYLTTTNCTDSAGASACSAAPAGSIVLDAAATTVVVSTTAVTANSQIFIQEDSSLGTRLGVTCNTTTGRDYTVTARTAATSFTITSTAAPVTNPACLSFFILN